MSNNRNSPAQLQVRPFLGLFLKPQPSAEHPFEWTLSSVGRLYKVIRLEKAFHKHLPWNPTLLQELVRIQRIFCCFDAKLTPTWILKVKHRELPCFCRSRCTTKVWLYVFAWFCMQTIRIMFQCQLPFSTEPLSITTSEVDDDAIKHPSSRAKATQGWKYVA